jgi:peptidyl-tRNA hydrolase, PTH1 family
MAEWLIVGLGNPGSEYERTRHNIGFLAVDALADRLNADFSKNKKSPSLVAQGRHGDHKLTLVKPMTYMNRSGQAVAPLALFYKIPAQNIIVLHDELDLDFQRIRMKLGGGDNGHNGLKSIRSSLGTGDWYRVRLGIGRPVGQMDPASYVLKPFSVSEWKETLDFCDRAAAAVETLIDTDLATAQGRFNQ